MWQGTKEQFFEFYRTAARHLKTCFPSLRVGGFAGCGFYAVDDPSVSDFYKTFPVWFEDFLAYVTAPETQAPLDFFSWHLYLDRHRGPERIIRHANYVRELLDAAGLREVESIFNEWNYCGDGWDAMKEMPGAACVAAAFCLMQAGPIDKAMYYDALPTRTYCGLFYFPSQRTTPCYEAFKAFNELYKLGTAASCSTDEKDLYLCAAASESGQAFLLVNRSDEPRQVTPVLAGAAPAFVLHRLDADHPALVAVGTFRPGETLALPPLSILLCATATEAASSPAELDTTPFNGIAPN
jgi:xylan 1,4-beta-xylosidase